MKRGFIAGILIVWASAACAQGNSAPSDTSNVPKKNQIDLQQDSGLAPVYPSPPPVKTEDPKPSKQSTKKTARGAPSKLPPEPPAWVRPYLQATVGFVDSPKWTGVPFGAFAGMNFVASGNSLLGFRVGIEGAGTGPASVSSAFWQASVVGRVSYIAGERFLPYVVFGPVFAFSANKSAPGVTVGAGVEYRINENWSAAAELDYSHLGAAMNSYAWSPRQLDYSEFKASLLYHFPISLPQK
jgi:opacity protein-like surface antigen